MPLRLELTPVLNAFVVLVVHDKVLLNAYYCDAQNSRETAARWAKLIGKLHTEPALQHNARVQNIILRTDMTVREVFGWIRRTLVDEGIQLIHQDQARPRFRFSFW